MMKRSTSRGTALAARSMAIGSAFLLGPLTATAQTPAQATPAITVVDARPSIEAQKKTLSLWIGSCDYFVVRVDDKAMTIGRIAQLRNDLAQKLGDRLSDDTITVKHYTMYLNGGVQMVHVAFAAAAGSVGGVLVGGKPVPHAKCSKEKMTAGWFDSSEVTTSQPPLITEAEIEFRGKTYTARHVYSPEKEFNEVSSNPKYGVIKTNIFTIINLDLATQIERDLPPAGTR